MIEEFKTPDISLSVALKITGASMTALEPIGRDKYLFVFYQTQEVVDAIDSFYRGELQAPIQETLTTLRKLKQAIKYDQKL